MTDTHTDALPVPHAEQEAPALYVYLRTGEPMGTLAGGAVAVEDALVAYTVLQDYQGATVRVSTAFLGVDASLGMEPQPLLWESVISGGQFDRGLYRYPSEAEALQAHAQIVQALVDGMTTDPEPAAPAPEPEEPPATTGPHEAIVPAGSVDLDEVAAGIRDAAAVGS